VPEDVPLAAAPRRMTPATEADPSPTGGAAPAGMVGELVGAPPAPDRSDAWNTGLGRWDLFYAVVFVATLVIVWVSSHGTERIVALAALAAMLPWYLLVGRPHILSSGSAPSVRGTVYLAGLVVLFAAAASVDPNTWYLAFALIPQGYMVTSARRAIVPAIALNLIGAASVGYAEQSASGVAIAAGLAAFGIAFAVVYSGYIVRIIEQSAERADLITQLEATRAELAAVSREAGALAERQRLAADIHDTLAQGFSSILMLIQAAEAQLELSPASARSQLDLAAQTARDNLAEARSLVSGLASAQLQAGTLTDALRRITERSASELDISACFDAAGTERPLQATTEVVLLRTGQEALANVRKHASATTVAVRLCYAADRVRLEVTDDGVGFNPALVNGGYGLRGMRGRVAEAGGTVTVRSAPGEGTSVQVEVPA
jgi:signal transduction histidine kinase